MEKPGNEKLSKPLLPLILLLMLVILITVIISNLRRDIQQPLTDMQPIPGTPALSTSITTTDSPVVEIFSKEEQIISTAIKKYRLGEIREAENDFRTILVFDPNHQAALTYLGTIFFSQKKYKSSIAVKNNTTKITSLIFSGSILRLFIFGAYLESSALGSAITGFIISSRM